jgi:hypothetical protein
MANRRRLAGRLIETSVAYQGLEETVGVEPKLLLVRQKGGHICHVALLLANYS